MAARVAQIRFSPHSPHPSNPAKKDSFNRTSSHAKVRPLRNSMYQAPHQHDRMAYPPTKPQQAGTRRPNHISNNQEDAIRERAGGARGLPQTPRKSPRQNWEREANVMKTLPRQPKRRQPLQDMDCNRGADQQRISGLKDAMESERSVDLFTMIDNHLAWNMSASDLANRSSDPPRPSSSGTMFVDFRADGEVEVSYRNGVNKKLPTPPVPSKIPGPFKPASPRRTGDIKPNSKNTKYEHRTEALLKPRSNRPSQSSRHDSVLDPSTRHSIDVSLPPSFPPPNQPLPPLPSRNLVKPQNGKSYPPQANATSRTISTSKAHYFSPALATTTCRTTRDEVEDVYTVIQPEGMRSCYRSDGLTTSLTVDEAAYGQAARTKSRPESQKTLYLDIPVLTHRSSPNASLYAASTHTPLKKMDTNKPLPPLPPVSREPAYACADVCSQEPDVLKKETKRHKVARFVKKVLRKIEGLADDFGEHSIGTSACRIADS
ncbi:hypothetical protein E8E12_006917 [Didymella heteroderae]|uniref:Uncharacterized protein n=1 Tax=Didymella heteroderae TaxID=1769908 RepID=A0A9P4WLK6_9PLEO|nr:hypothetical protein E8E12_006917 [Didymella heteroderae]